MRTESRDMKKQYDFSHGVRGKFRNPDGDFSIPIYLDPRVAELIAKLSAEEKMPPSQVVNELL